jgi:hypothetical protein
MKYVYINNLGYLNGPSVIDAETKLEVDEITAEKLSSWPLGKIWRYNKDTAEFQLEPSFDDKDFRVLRDTECFAVINRSFLWYSNLSEEQKLELQTWYQAWLDITETRKIPAKPTWLD